MGPYITEPGTPVADMWQAMFGGVDKKGHMQKMFDLTTRMNALARVTLGNANISATTALQVRRGGGSGSSRQTTALQVRRGGGEGLLLSGLNHAR